MPQVVYPVNPQQAGQINALIQTTRNGINSVIGYRQDLVPADVIGASLTNNTGVVSYEWQLIGRPEGSGAGGAGPEPISLGFAPSASFTVDGDASAFLDGTYLLQCIVNGRSPTETRIRVALVRMSPSALADGSTLRHLGANETSEDTSLPTRRQGFANMANRLLRGVVSAIKGPEGALMGNPSAEDTWTGSRPNNVHLVGQRTALLGDVVAALPAANLLYAVPWVLGVEARLARLLLKQRAGTTGNMRFGVYGNVAKSLYPGALLYDSGSLAFAGGTRVVASPNIRLPVGVAWLVLQFDATAIANAVTVDHLKSTAMPPVLGTASDLLDAGGAGVNFGVAWTHALAFGALPATFPDTSPTQIKTSTAPNVPTAYADLRL